MKRLVLAVLFVSFAGGVFADNPRNAPGSDWRGRISKLAPEGYPAEIGGVGKFAGAYVLNEVGSALLTHDPEQIKKRFAAMARPEFVGQVAAFSVVGRAVEKLLDSTQFRVAFSDETHAMLKLGLPFAVGMGVIDEMSGHHGSIVDHVKRTAAFMLSSLLINGLGQAPLTVALLSIGPVGWYGAALLQVTRFAAALYLGGQIEKGIDVAFQGVVKFLKWEGRQK